MNLRTLAGVCRPGQWVKNLFVMLPLFFSGNLLDMRMGVEALVALAAFCLASSAVYCLNDCMDADADRQHPVKCRRPVASGEISKGSCMLLTALLTVGAIALLFLLPYEAAILSTCVVGGYLLLNFAYCLRLKRIAIIDVAIIATGFVLRVVAGGTSTGIFISHWIIIMTFLLALFLSLSKRRDDTLIYIKTGKKMRQNIESYNLDFLNQATTLVATVTLVSYIMYTVSPEVVARFNTGLIYVTSVFVLMGLLRYFQLTVVYAASGSPTKIFLHDRFIQGCIAGWIITFALIIYF